MNGKESDVKRASELRESFVYKFNEDKVFVELLEGMEKDYIDKLIYKLAKDLKISVAKNYRKLKERVEKIRIQQSKEMFIKICLIENARLWVNDNEKYIELILEAAYILCKEDEKFLETLS